MHPSAHKVLAAKSVLPDGVPYLPVLFSDAGYRTLAVSNNAHFSARYGFGRGFGEMFDYYLERQAVLIDYPSAKAQAEQVWNRFLGPAFQASGEEPVFAVLHEIDPHSPYQAPAPYSNLYDFGYSGNIDGWEKRFSEHLLVFRLINDYGSWVSEEDKDQLRSLYKAEVSFVDEYFGALLEKLDESGRRDSTLIVFLSDHGEQLFEHDLWGHGNSLYQEELQVPLIFSLPGVLPEGGRSRALVQLADVAPTLLDLAGIQKPKGLQGRSLVPDMLGSPGVPAFPPPIFSWSNLTIYADAVNFYRSKKSLSVRLGRWKLLRTSRRKGQVHVEYELYDLENDPGEERDRWAEERVVGHTLRQLIEAKTERDRLLDFPSEPISEMDGGVLESLRELGYVE
jgi:arylsulfatase A-like enzyme